jgi:predicted metal-binding protein
MITYLYRTHNGNEYPVELGFANISVKEISYDYEYITGLCRQGCKNFNHSGGCPPFAPTFEDIAGQYCDAILVFARLHSRYKTQRVWRSNNYYIHYRFQDIILSNFLNKMGQKIREMFAPKIYFLGNGYCTGCGSRRCAYKEGVKKCRFPQKRTFSLEATGINVEKTLKDVFDLELEWYNRSNFRQVSYLTKAVGFFCCDPAMCGEVRIHLDKNFL